VDPLQHFTLSIGTRVLGRHGDLNAFSSTPPIPRDFVGRMAFQVRLLKHHNTGRRALQP
jgi:hypothetical protein